jgi:hypothetical protein
MTIIRYQGHQITIQDENYYNPASIQRNPSAALTITKIVLPIIFTLTAVATAGIYAGVVAAFELSVTQGIGATIVLAATGGTIGNYLKPRTVEEELGPEHINVIVDSLRFTYDWSLGTTQDDNDVNPAGDTKDSEM